jgi:hypothetical protein
MTMQDNLSLGALLKEQVEDDAVRRQADMERWQKEHADSKRLEAELLARCRAGEPAKLFECDTFEWNKDARGWGKKVPFGEGPFIKAPECWVNQYLTQDELRSAFAEWLFWPPPPSPPVPEMPGRAIVTKGQRRIARLKKMLLERGARFVVERGEGPMPGADHWSGITRKR